MITSKDLSICSKFMAGRIAYKFIYEDSPGFCLLIYKYSDPRDTSPIRTPYTYTIYYKGEKYILNKPYRERDDRSLFKLIVVVLGNAFRDREVMGWP